YRHSNEQFYGAPDSLICQERPFLHISNISNEPGHIQKGDVVGIAHKPTAWLDCRGQYSSEQNAHIVAHASLLKSLAEDCATSGTHSSTTRAIVPSVQLREITEDVEDPLAEDPVEGGPKTSEVPPDDTPAQALRSVIDISQELTADQRARIMQVVLRNEAAFALDGRLGTVDAKCTIPLRPGAKEVSLPPFPSSPAKREVM
ncbi:hypothetical protein BV20DRAFT_929415, partial [Pilatotrama ljubarskyi]